MIHDKWDLLSSLIKQKDNETIKVIIDGQWLTVTNWYVDWAIDMLTLKFEEIDQAYSYHISTKFTVDIISERKKHNKIKLKITNFFRKGK